MNRFSRRGTAFLEAGLVAAALTFTFSAVPSQAQGKPQSAPPAAPAPSQSLGALPSAQDMIDRWLPICVDNAGNPEAQRRAGQAANLSLPYSLRVEEGTTIGDTCTLVSLANPQSSTEATVELLRAQLSPRGTINIGANGQYFGGDFLYRGYSYRVIGMVQAQSGSPTPTFILVLSTGENRRPPRRR